MCLINSLCVVVVLYNVLEEREGLMPILECACARANGRFWKVKTHKWGCGVA